MVDAVKGRWMESSLPQPNAGTWDHTVGAVVLTLDTGASFDVIHSYFYALLGPYRSIRQAAKTAQVDDFIESLPRGYDTLISDKLLSGGASGGGDGVNLHGVSRFLGRRAMEMSGKSWMLRFLGADRTAAAAGHCQGAAAGPCDPDPG